MDEHDSFQRKQAATLLSAEPEWQILSKKILDYIEYGPVSAYYGEKDKFLLKFRTLEFQSQVKITTNILARQSQQELNCLKYCLSFFRIKIDPIERRCAEFLSQCRERVLKLAQNDLQSDMHLKKIN